MGNKFGLLNSSHLTIWFIFKPVAEITRKPNTTILDNLNTQKPAKQIKYQKKFRVAKLPDATKLQDSN